EWSTLRAFPWIVGTLLFIFLTVPWFVFAERASPGLVHYFFINENFERYISPDYQDLYGTSHRVFRAAIVPFTLAAMMPWGLVFLRSIRKQPLRDARHSWPLFLFLWAIAPAVFFLPSDNVLMYYALPGVPGMLLFVAHFVASGKSAVPTWARRTVLFFLVL